MAEVSSKSSTQGLVDKLSSLKREAFSNLDQALSFDTHELNSNPHKCDQTIIMYEKCLHLIDKTLNFYEQYKSSLIKSDEAVSIHSHVVSIRNQTLERVNKLKSDRMKIVNQQGATNLHSEFLAAGDEILNDDFLIIDDIPVEPKSTDKTQTDKPEPKIQNFTNANEILRVDDGVQLFYIANDGTVSTPSYPATLSIYTFNEAEKRERKMEGFIRVGDWIYPLVANESPGMKTNFNAYIFPNDQETESEPKFSFVGITFSENVSNEDKQFFEDVLSNLSSLVFQDPTSETGVKRPIVSPSVSGTAEGKKTDENIPKTWSAERIAQNIINGAQYLSDGLATGTDYASKYMKTGGEKLKNNLQPAAEPVTVDPKVKKVVQNVRYGTHVTVKVSSFLINKLSSIATSTAKTVAPHIKNGSSAILSKTGIAGSKNDASNYVENVCTVAHGSVKGFGIVYDSLEQAAKNLGKSFAEETVTVVDHKYGPEAAKVAENGLYSAGNVAISVNNFKNLKIVRTLAKATAKETLSSSSKLSTQEKDDTKSQEKSDKDKQLN